MLRAPHPMYLAVALVMAACTSAPPAGPPDATAPSPAPTLDAATRATPVVPGRPSRVFIMAAWGADCQSLAAPEITITEPPRQGDISFVPGQETTVAASAQGTCAGRSVSGTGIYYTARLGASGSDRFSVTARLATGETTARTFEVRIAE